MAFRELTLATAQEYADVNEAIFGLYKQDALNARGTASLDTVRSSGKAVQVTTGYAARALTFSGVSPNRVYAPKPRTLVVDDVVAAMQGRSFRITSGRLVTIDVSGAVTPTGSVR